MRWAASYAPIAGLGSPACFRTSARSTSMSATIQAGRFQLPSRTLRSFLLRLVKVGARLGKVAGFAVSDTVTLQRSVRRAPRRVSRRAQAIVDVGLLKAGLSR